MWVPHMHWLGRNWSGGPKVQMGVNLGADLLFIIYRGPKSQDSDT